MMHPDTFVAQTSCAMTNHFYKSIMAANEYDGPAIVSVYTTCQPEHGVGDNMAMAQSKLAVDTRTFPVLVYDPRKGSKISERLSLQGNPATTEDYYKDPKTGEAYDFTMFARSEGRFSKHFAPDGTPSDTILATREERLRNWHVLQELAGLR
jgi:pyruvate/2-oxoacid:ferredoxin oxidoreductase beta subunit